MRRGPRSGRSIGPLVRRAAAPPPGPAPPDPAAPTVDGELVADLVPRPAGPPPDELEPLTAFNTVTDIRCTAPACRREVRDIPMIEALTARPCPLCARCPTCRELCRHGRVDHGLDPGW